MPDIEARPGLDDLRRQAEAVLFSLGAAIDRRKLADTLEVDQRTLASVLDALDVSLEGRGLMLQRHGDLVQLVTRPEASAAVRRLLNPEVPGRLSPAAYETLAIIAYRQPLTKAAIEEVRGVDCERVLEGLLARGLIEERGRLEAAGTPRLFGTTIRFLQLLGVSRVEDLPGLAGADGPNLAALTSALDGDDLYAAPADAAPGAAPTDPVWPEAAPLETDPD